MQELAIRGTVQQKQEITVEHITGKLNIANLFTKEIKDTNHFNSLALSITNPCQISEILQTASSQTSLSSPPSTTVSSPDLDVPTLTPPATPAALVSEGGIEANSAVL
jgi:hypothetical protein